MKVWMRFFIMLLLAVGLAACAQPTPTGEEPVSQATEPVESAGSTDPTTAPTEEMIEGPQHGGTLIVAIGSDPEHLNSTISSSVTVGFPSDPVTEALIHTDRDGNVVPQLARTWEVSDDGLTYTFHLVENAKWHDGEAFTSADVKFTYEEISPFHARTKAVFDNIASIETPDDFTVVITLTNPFSPFLAYLTPSNSAIQAKHIYEGTDILANPSNLAPVGTGPFKFERWEPGEFIEVVRNDEYWNAPEPYLDRIIFKIIPDANAQILALEAGEVDYIPYYYINFVEVSRLQENPDLHVEMGRGTPRVLLLFFNTLEEPFDNVKVRQALFMAIDRELILESAYGGIGSLGRSSIPPGLVKYYNPEVDYMEMYPYDLAEAAALLDEAGYPVGSDGTRFEARFLFDPNQPGFNDIGDILRSGWESIGVTAVLEPRERSVWLEELYQNKDFDTALSFYTTRGDVLLGVQRAYLCDEIRQASFTNASQYCNPELDELFVKGGIAVTVEERAEFYYEAQEIIARDLPSAVLMNSGFADVLSTRFGNIEEFFRFPDSSEEDWTQIYLIEP